MLEFDKEYRKDEWIEFFDERFEAKDKVIDLFSFFSKDELEEAYNKYGNFVDIEKCNYIGDLRIIKNDYTMPIYEVVVKKTKENTKVKLFRLAVDIIRGKNKQGLGNGIFFFIYGDDDNALKGKYRLSYVNYGVRFRDAKIVKESTNPKRYSFLLGEGTKTKTPRQKLNIEAFESIESIEEAFSVEAVNIEFYKGIKTHFDMINEDVFDAFKKNDFASKNFSLRFLGRILFCWFLKEKNFIPKELFEVSDNYYKNVLYDLFFNVLNCKMDERNIESSIMKKYEGEIPFLNGGLFAAHDDEKEIYEIKDETIKSLFDFFNSYNFTVDESSAFDEEVSIDPEMLGRIFEELLNEIVNPEIKTANNKNNQRNKTGSFYTPREIVDYMITSSIMLYLKNKTSIDSDKLDNIFNIEDGQCFSEEEKKEIIKSIHKIKILDPACGSGAFPIGVLHRIFYLIDKLDFEHKYYKNEILLSIENSAIREEMEDLFNRNKLNYAYKLDILKKSIYGVDIQPIAIEISRLRAFLSLIVDERKEEDNDNNFGIKPLPNLEFQFVCANSLKGIDFNLEDGSMERYFLDGALEKMANISKMFFSASSSKEKSNVKYRFLEFQEFVKNCDYIRDDIKEVILSWNPFENKSVDFFHSIIQFGVNDKFDVVIGNPPYGAEISAKDRVYFEQMYALSTTNTAALFLGLMKKLFKPYSVGAYIIPKSFIYASNWSNARDLMINDLYELIDCGKVWKEVKLEQVITLFEKGLKNDSYITSIREDKEIKRIGDISKNTYKEFGFYLNAVSNDELNIAYKMRKSSLYLNDFIVNRRGAGYQKLCIDEVSNKEKCYKVLGGKNISRYLFPENSNKFILESDILDDKAYIKENSILAQNIITYTDKPQPTVIIKALSNSEVNKNEYIILDTINQLTNKSNFDINLILAILNSKLISWYTYRFIYAKAVMTMHFDSVVTAKIPMPSIDLNNKKDKEYYNKILVLVDSLIKENKNLKNEKNINNINIKNRYINMLENQIEEILLEIYGIKEYKNIIFK